MGMACEDTVRGRTDPSYCQSLIESRGNQALNPMLGSGFTTWGELTPLTKDVAVSKKQSYAKWVGIGCGCLIGILALVVFVLYERSKMPVAQSAPSQPDIYANASAPLYTSVSNVSTAPNQAVNKDVQFGQCSGLSKNFCKNKFGTCPSDIGKELKEQGIVNPTCRECRWSFEKNTCEDLPKEFVKSATLQGFM